MPLCNVTGCLYDLHELMRLIIHVLGEPGRIERSYMPTVKSM